MPKVSVIVPVYRTKDYIKDCIQSLQKQTIRDIEVLLIDDCGGDGSMAIVREMAQDDSRLKIITHPSNLGPMMARYNGVVEAQGDYITFCDSDDLLPDNAIELLLSKAKESNADIVSGCIDYFYTNNHCKRWNNTLLFGGDKVSVYKSLLLEEFTHNLCGKLFRSDILKNHAYSHFEHFTNGEDAIFFYEIVDNIVSAVTIPKVVYWYRQTPNSSTQLRFSRQKLENVVIGGAMMYKKCIQYSELATMAHRHFSKWLNILYAKGYNKDGVLDALIKKYQLEELVRPFDVLRYLPLYVKQVLKRCIR
jgi:glycosyltransferase involved in cell wall biosynthesis